LRALLEPQYPKAQPPMHGTRRRQSPRQFPEPPAPLRYVGVLGTRMRRVTVGFLGWFGPRGLASIMFVLVLMEETELPERPLMLTVVTWTVALSVYAHGLTAWPGANRYADWYAAHATDHAAMPESAPVCRAAPSRPRAPPARIGTSIVLSDSLSDAP
jgi:hypothetical protein